MCNELWWKCLNSHSLPTDITHFFQLCFWVRKLLFFLLNPRLHCHVEVSTPLGDWTQYCAFGVCKVCSPESHNVVSRLFLVHAEIWSILYSGGEGTEKLWLKDCWFPMLRCFCTGDSRLVWPGFSSFFFAWELMLWLKIIIGGRFSTALKHQGESVTS